MSDKKERELERAAANGDEDAMDRLKREWLRSQVYRSCSECNADVPDGVWAEHQAAHEKEAEAKANRPSGMRVIPVPAPASIGSRPRKNPLYDRVVVPAGGASHSRFFVGESKPIWETNLGRPLLPEQSHFYWYGVSLVPDARAHPDDVALIYDTGLLSVSFGNTRLLDLPGRVVMDDMPTIQTQDGEEEQQRVAWEAQSVLNPDPRFTRLRNEGPVRDLTLSGRPIEIHALQDVRIELDVEPGIQRDTGVMLVMFGILLRAITG